VTVEAAERAMGRALEGETGFLDARVPGMINSPKRETFTLDQRVRADVVMPRDGIARASPG
jgi:hypothetical protein